MKTVTNLEPPNQAMLSAANSPLKRKGSNNFSSSPLLIKKPLENFSMKNSNNSRLKSNQDQRIYQASSQSLAKKRNEKSNIFNFFTVHVPPSNFKKAHASEEKSLKKEDTTSPVESRSFSNSPEKAIDDLQNETQPNNAPTSHLSTTNKNEETDVLLNKSIEKTDRLSQNNSPKFTTIEMKQHSFDTMKRTREKLKISGLFLNTIKKIPNSSPSPSSVNHLFVLEELNFIS